MAFENLLIRSPATIGGLRIDGSIEEDTSQSMRVTQNPVESGEIVTDNIVEEPRRFVLTGVITDTPLGVGAFTDSSAYAIGGGISRFTGLLGSSTPSGATRSSSAYQALHAMMLRKELISIDTNLGTFENLAFQSLSVIQNKSTAKAIHFRATFMEMLIVSSQYQGLQPENIVGTSGDKAAHATVTNSGAKATNLLTDVQETTTLGSALGFGGF